MYFHRVCALAAALLAAISACPSWAAGAAPQPITLYVSTNGSDAWTGRLSAPNTAKTDGPFASLARARDAVRSQKAAGRLAAPVRVLVRGGTYRLAEPFALSPEDSGTAECPITYAAYPGEKPVLSGGRALSGWTRHRGAVWACSVKSLGPEGLRFRQLFQRGERQVPARWPNRDPKRPRTGGFLYCESSPEMDAGKEIRYPAGAFPRRWARPTEVEVCIYPNYNWTNQRAPIATLDEAQRLIRLSRSVGPVWAGNRFYVFNAAEELDAPGEWYLDRATATLTFQPPTGSAPADVTVPMLESVVALRGDFEKNQFVEHVTLSHLGIECCHGNAVVLRAARHCGVIGCTVLQAGGAGVLLDAGSSFCRVAGNDIATPGGHAIAMYYSVGTPDACTDNIITNNYAHHCGEIAMCSFGWGSGIAISGKRNTLSHNLVHDTAYSAINFDGYDHVIEYNHVHHTSLEGADCGALYGWVNTKAGSGNITIRHNRIHDSVGFGMVERGRYQTPYFSWGIYLDDYLSHCTITGNLVYRAWRAPLHLHGGWNNTVENNVFADGALSQVDLSNMPRHKPSLSGITGKDAPGSGEWSMSGIVLRRNILCGGLPDSATYGGSGFEERVVSEADGNLYWHNGRPPRMRLAGWPPEDSWRLWRAGGRDAHSLVANPGFVRPDRDDYRLRPNSPALKLGFRPLPIERMGLGSSPERASWPVVEASVSRDPAIPPPPPPPGPGIPIGRAYAAIGPIRIDGKMGADEWGDTTRSRGFPIAQAAGRGPTGAPDATAHVRCDSARLYVALAAEKEPEAVEVFVQPLAVAGAAPALLLRGYPSGKWERIAPGGTGRPDWKPADRPALPDAAGSPSPKAAGKGQKAGASGASPNTLRPAGGAPEKASKPAGAPVRWAAAASGGEWTGEWQIPHALSGIVPGRTVRLRFNARVRRGGQWSAWVRDAGPEGAGYLSLEPAVPADAANVLANGGMEEGAGQPQGWTVNERAAGPAPPGAEKPRALWVAEGREGSRCLKIEAAKAEGARAVECWWSQSVERPAAGTYVLTYDVRAAEIHAVGEGGHFYACGWAWVKKGTERTGVNLGITRESRIENGSAPFWTRRETVLDVPANAESVIVLFGMVRAAGIVRVDNVRLEKCR